MNDLYVVVKTAAWDQRYRYAVIDTRTQAVASYHTTKSAATVAANKRNKDGE